MKDEVAKYWWQNKVIIHEMEDRYYAMETGEDKGLTLEDLLYSISKLKDRKYNISTIIK